MSGISFGAVKVTLIVPDGAREKSSPGHFGIRVGEPPTPFPSLTTIDYVTDSPITITLHPIPKDC